ncbi:hypothetical protein DW008_16090, partial [Sellimonas intestinalis]
MEICRRILEWIRKPRRKEMTKKQEEESACERVPDESEGKPDQEQELVEEIESFNDALSEIGKTAQEA